MGLTSFFCIFSAQSAPILTASTVNLALSVQGLVLNDLPSGQARTITITNKGDTPATGLIFTYPIWPEGSPTVINNCGSMLQAGETCTITVVPGATATTGKDNAVCTTGIAPTPGVVLVSASNAKPVSTKVVVLDYGCVYQGGFVYAMTETEDTSKSIGGKVVSRRDQAEPATERVFENAGVMWSSNGIKNSCTDFGGCTRNASYDLIPGIDEHSTTSHGSPSYSAFLGMFGSTAGVNTYETPSSPLIPPSSAFSSCNGAVDGACNTSNIILFYNTYVTHYIGEGSFGNPTPPHPFLAPVAGPTPLTEYAAGLCASTIEGYSDWYLPAICEMDAMDTFNGEKWCPKGTQSMVEHLNFLLGDPSWSGSGSSASTSCAPPTASDCLAGEYWSSTEEAWHGEQQQTAAFLERFAAGDNHQEGSGKLSNYGVRCSRALTI